jgi:hypothetical protein
MVKHVLTTMSALVLIASVLHARPARAENTRPTLILPLVAALAIGRSVVALHTAVTTTPSFRDRLPKQLVIPDGYEIDFGRDPRRFADPVDRDKLVGFDLLPRRQFGAMLSFSYDEESRPIADRGSDLFRLQLEWVW